MKFGTFPIAETEEMILAHSVRTPERVFRKGHRITATDIEALRASGHETVYAARLSDDDVPEDEAAGRLATALKGTDEQAEPPFTGRANIYAEKDGVLILDANAVAAINAIDEAITVATLPPFAHVTAGQMIATVKIIPFAAPMAALNKAVGLAVASPVLTVRPFRIKTADLILTTVEGTKEKLLEKSKQIVAGRLEALGISLAATRICLHTEDAVADALLASPETSELTLILGASATVDRQDVVPAGLVRARGTIMHFGMPVDPGNLLLLGSIGERPVIGLPGCARSPKLNGADWVLQRLTAGVDVTAADIQAMGVGGLLKEIPSRPQPRTRKLRPGSAPRIAAIILAAGRSERMGDINKLTAEIAGKPMVAHVADAALSSRADEIILVTGHQKDAVQAALAGRPMSEVHNPDYAAGLGTSVAAGIATAAALDPPVDGALVLLGDMPLIDAELIDALIAAHDPDEECLICVPTVNGKRGNPVLWDAAFFADLQTLTGDVGARHLIAENADFVCEVPVDGEGALLDIDTPEKLAERRD
mgnify:CR=1 FL=1